MNDLVSAAISEYPVSYINRLIHGLKVWLIYYNLLPFDSATNVIAELSHQLVESHLFYPSHA